MLNEDSKANMKKFSLVLISTVFIVLYSCTKGDDKPLTKIGGYAFGTSFNIIYQDQKDYTTHIDSLFHLINKSLSTYISSSDISKINKGDSTIIVDAYFQEVFQKTQTIFNETNGVFDPTIGILVNAWGFGPNESFQKPDSIRIHELLQLVGFDNVKLEDGKVIKSNDSIYFDFNAIAKGYAVDIAGRFLEEKNIDNYLVEIGGEIRTRGKKNDSIFWKAGIENPNFDGSRSIHKIITLHNEAMATSGSYRKFKTDSITGKKFVHILNPKTGYPTQSSLLSVSVIAALDCADVDGYATALMAMSLENAKQFLKNHKELKCFLIYSDANGSLQSYQTENF